MCTDCSSSCGNCVWAPAGIAYAHATDCATDLRLTTERGSVAQSTAGMHRVSTDHSGRSRERAPGGVVMGPLGSPTALDAYRTSLAGISPLTAEEERTLAARWRNGEQDAGRRIVEASLPFVITIATEYRRWGVPLEDLIQQGNLGLLKAAMRFDPSRECRLITYAVYWIRAEIRDYVVRGYRLVRIGGSKAERRALRAYRKTHEDDPVKLGAAAGLNPERVARLLPLLKQRDVSLDAAEPGETPAVDRLRSQEPSPEEDVQEAFDREQARLRVREALGTLNDRERWILEHRVLAEDESTLESLGQKLGISKERVRQIEARALQKLRGALTDLAA